MSARGVARGFDVHVLRYLPGDTPVHRLWAGTKLACLGALGLALAVNPTWWGEAVLGALVAVAIAVARVPRGAAPRLPRWVLVALVMAGTFALLGGGRPDVTVAGWRVGLGGILAWARLTAMAALLVGAAAVVGWTTPLAELGPALARLLAPLRWLRLPVEELVLALALAVRCLPLLADELRTLAAARRARHVERRRGMRGALGELHDILVTALVAAVRRAREMADAMEARGGPGHARPERVRLGGGDALALGVAGAAAAAILLA